MSIKSQKAGTQFGKLAVKHHGQLTDTEWCQIMLAVGFPADARVLAEGLAVLHNENGGSTSNMGQGASGHIGAWAESPAFGSVSQRLDSVESTKAALVNWKENAAQSGSRYGNFEQAWGQWEAAQGGKNVQQEYLHYVATAQAALNGSSGTSGGGGGWIGGIPDPGDLFEKGEAVVNAGMSAADFLAEMASTLLDFRKLGHLAVSAFAWGLRLLLKAIWDYVFAPLWHWMERAETFYWRNFFGTGTQRGSGFGYQLRENAGIITIGFWALGYAVLWSGGDSLAPVDSHESMMGRAIKGVEGKVARRNLVKPSDVEDETPDKPKPKSSSVTIERVKEFSVNRKRPVSVGTSDESSTGRNSNNDGSQRQQRVPRPSEQKEPAQTAEEQKQIIRVPQTRVKTHSPEAEPKAAAASGPGSNSRTHSGAGTKGSGSAG